MRKPKTYASRHRIKRNTFNSELKGKKIDTPEMLSKVKKIIHASGERAMHDKDYAIQLAVGTGMYNNDGSLKDEFNLYKSDGTLKEEFR